MAEKNKVKFGLSNVHVAKMIKGEDGAITYDTPFKIPGAVNLSLDAEGDNEPFYADNIVYYSASNNNGYSGDLEIADIPESFQKDVLGYTVDNNGALIENADATIKPFALLFEVTGDEKPRRSVLYNCMVTRPSTEASTTEDTRTPQTDTLNITATPREDNKNVKAIMTLSDSNTTAFNSFFSNVYEPSTIPSV